MKLTKKAFREHLNRESADAPKHRHGRYQQRTRPYGDYLYHQDRAKFDVDYAEWLAAKTRDMERLRDRLVHLPRDGMLPDLLSSPKNQGVHATGKPYLAVGLSRWEGSTHVVNRIDLSIRQAHALVSDDPEVSEEARGEIRALLEHLAATD